MNINKARFLGFALILIMALTLAACSRGNHVSNSTFPSIEDADIPDILEITVGTLGDTYFSSGITDNSDYNSVLIATFKNTTEADYDILMEHYQSTSTGKDEDGYLLFDWGRLQVKTDNDSISITALIKQ